MPSPGTVTVALARVGAIVDEPRFHGHLTGRQNLQILAAAREPAAKGRVDSALERVGILHRADDKVSKYSMGMRQRLGVAACLLGDPQLLILDEPMNGLDPAGMLDMRDMISSLVAEGRTVVLSSHLLDEVERTCDAVAIVDRGTVIRQGPDRPTARGVLVRGADRVLRSRPGAQPARRDGLWHTCAESGRTDSRSRYRRTRERDAIAEINRLLVEGGICRVPAPAHPSFARAVVPVGDQPSGRSRMTTVSDIEHPLRVRLPAQARPKCAGITGARGSRRGA